MTANRALKVVRRASLSNEFVDPDVLNFRGVTKEEVVAALRSAKSHTGEGRSFVVDKYITVVIDGIIFVLGVGR